MTLFKQKIVLWILSVGFVCGLLWQVPYVPRDGDGRLYTAMASDLADKDVSELLALKWYGHCEIYERTSSWCQYFYEHPPGMFVLPFVLTKFGVPPQRVTLVADVIYQLLLLLGMFLLLQPLMGSQHTIGALHFLQLIPIATMYSLRATQETPLLVCLVYGLVTLQRFSVSSFWRYVILFFIVGIAALLKGVLVAPMLMVLVLFAFFKSNTNRVGNVLMLSVVLVLSAYCSLTLFEMLRLRQTGNSFWKTYLYIQFWYRAIETTSGVEVVRRTAFHFAYYLGCVVWYAFPWSFVAMVCFWRHVRKKMVSSRKEEKTRGDSALFAFLAVAIAIQVVAFSFFARYSLRYIFPVYFLLAWCGLIIADRRGFFRLFASSKYGLRLSGGTLAVLWGVIHTVVILSNVY